MRGGSTRAARKVGSSRASIDIVREMEGNPGALVAGPPALVVPVPAPAPEPGAAPPRLAPSDVNCAVIGGGVLGAHSSAFRLFPCTGERMQGESGTAGVRAVDVGVCRRRGACD